MGINLKRFSINEHRVKEEFKSREDIENLVANTSSLSFSACPYSITLGAISTSEAGYRNKYSRPTDFTDFQRVFSGRSGVIVV
jgi:hypothetical protein